MILLAVRLAVMVASRILPAVDAGDCLTQDSVGQCRSVLENITERPGDLLEEELVVADSAANRYNGLTDADFNLVAEELGVEPAAIKAVVSIEAGSAMKGFWQPGVPIVNFDRAVFSRYRTKFPGEPDKSAVTPTGLSGYAKSEWTQLTEARHKNSRAADLSTFWGMFQIGGFNYARCGCEDIREFVERMSESELSQLELFAAFIKNGGMLEDLKARNWAAFARKYNGASYAKRGYHTRMARAYVRFSAK